MSDFPGFSAAAADDLRAQIANVSRRVAAVMADPVTRAAERRPSTMGRRMAVVVTVNAGPPLTADVTLNDTLIPGVSPQCTYRPVVGDLVWLEFLGPDAHMSPPLMSDLNRRWTALTLEGAWVAAGNAGYTVVPGWWRDPLGIVHLRGSVEAGASPSNIAVVGNPPPGTLGFAVYCFAAGAVAAAGVTIDSAGALRYFGPAAPDIVSLDGITYRID